MNGESRTSNFENSGVGVVFFLTCSARTDHNSSSMRSLYSLFLLLSACIYAQPAAMSMGGHKTFLAVPMVGAGTWEDPKRPAFMKESGVSFRYQVSDDGTMALEIGRAHV